MTVVDPTTQYYDYVKTLDGRVSKSIRFGRKRLQVFMELFNLPNYATVLTVNETVGPLYFNPQAITSRAGARSSARRSIGRCVGRGRVRWMDASASGASTETNATRHRFVRRA